MGKKESGTKFNPRKPVSDIKSLLRKDSDESLEELSKFLTKLAESKENLDDVIKRDAKEGAPILSKEVIESTNFPDDVDHIEFQNINHEDVEQRERFLSCTLKSLKIELLIGYGFIVKASEKYPISVNNPHLVKIFLRHNSTYAQKDGYVIVSLVNNRLTFLNKASHHEGVHKLKCYIGAGESRMAKTMLQRDKSILKEANCLHFALMRLIENSNPDLPGIKGKYEELFRHLIDVAAKRPELGIKLSDQLFQCRKITLLGDKNKVAVALHAQTLMETAYEYGNYDAVKILHEIGGVKIADKKPTYSVQPDGKIACDDLSVIQYAIEDPKLLQYTLEKGDNAKIFRVFDHLGELKFPNPFANIDIERPEHLESLSILIRKVFGEKSAPLVLSLAVGEEKYKKLTKSKTLPEGSINTDELRLMMACFEMSISDIIAKTEIADPILKEVVPRMVAKCDDLAREFCELHSSQENHFSEIEKAKSWIARIKDFDRRLLEQRESGPTNEFLDLEENAIISGIVRLKMLNILISPTSIRQAIDSNDRDILNLILDEYTELDILTSSKITTEEGNELPMTYAAKKSPKMLKALFENGIDTLPAIFLATKNKDSVTALKILNEYQEFQKRENPEMADAIMAQTVNTDLNGSQLLIEAIESRSPKLVAKLIELKADVSISPTSKPGTNPLMYCCQLEGESQRDIGIAKMLIKEGASYIADSESLFTAAHQAVRKGGIEKLKLLAELPFFKEDGFINRATSGKYGKDFEGNTLLYMACMNPVTDNDAKVVELLLKKGAQITPKILNLAMGKASFEVVKMLWEHSSDEVRSAEVTDEESPETLKLSNAHYACTNPDKRVAQYMIAKIERKEHLYMPIMRADRNYYRLSILHAILLSQSKNEDEKLELVKQVIDKFPDAETGLLTQLYSVDGKNLMSALALAVYQGQHKITDYLLSKKHPIAIYVEQMFQHSPPQFDGRQRPIITFLKDRINAQFTETESELSLKEGSQQQIDDALTSLCLITSRADKEDPLVVSCILKSIGIDNRKIALLTKQRSPYVNKLTLEEVNQLALAQNYGYENSVRICATATKRSIEKSLFEALDSRYKPEGCKSLIEVLAKAARDEESHSRTTEEIKAERIANISEARAAKEAAEEALAKRKAAEEEALAKRKAAEEEAARKQAAERERKADIAAEEELKRQRLEVKKGLSKKSNAELLADLAKPDTTDINKDLIAEIIKERFQATEEALQSSKANESRLAEKLETANRQNAELAERLSSKEAVADDAKSLEIASLKRMNAELGAKCTVIEEILRKATAKFNKTKDKLTKQNEGLTNKLTTLKARHEAKLEKLKAYHEASITAQKEALEAKYAAQLTAQKEALEEKHLKEPQEFQTSHAAQLEAQQKDLEAKLKSELEARQKALEAKHAEDMETLKAKHAEDMRALKTSQAGLRADHVALEKQHSRAMEELDRLQYIENQFQAAIAQMGYMQHMQPIPKEMMQPSFPIYPGYHPQQFMTPQGIALPHDGQSAEWPITTTPQVSEVIRPAPEPTKKEPHRSKPNAKNKVRGVVEEATKRAEKKREAPPLNNDTEFPPLTKGDIPKKSIVARSKAESLAIKGANKRVSGP